MLYHTTAIAGSEILVIPTGTLLFPVYVIEIENQFITPVAIINRVYGFLRNYHVTLILLWPVINTLLQI